MTERRQRALNSRCNLTRGQLRAIWTLHSAGMTLGEISRKGWRRWGYANEATCVASIRRALRMDGLKPRGRWFADSCAGCGGRFDDRTLGCDPCKQRHHRRRLLGRPFVRAPGRTVCSGCDGPVDDFTGGCETCYQRHWNRRMRVAA